MGLLARLSAIEARLRPWQVGALLLGLLLALRSDVLTDPPYWDTLMGAFPQALWLERHGFDSWELLTTQADYVHGGLSVYPFSLYPTLVGALYACGLSPHGVFVVLHLVNFVCAAATAGAFFSIARRRLPAPAASLLTPVLCSAPLFQSLTGQINLELALVACTALSFTALDQRRFAWAWAWSLVALLVKPTAVILIGASLCACAILWLRPRWSGLGDEALAPAQRRRARNSVLGQLALAALFLLELNLQSRYGKGPAFVELFGGFKPLFTRRLWVVPEFGLGLVLLLGSLPLLARRMLQGRARWIQVQCGLFVLVFVLFYGQYGNTLPRYFLQSYPYVLLGLALLLYGIEAHVRVRAGLLALACAFHLVNLGGRFYPSPPPSGWVVPGIAQSVPGNDGYLLERSLEYRADLRLNQKLARELERFDRATTVIVPNWALLHLLSLPELGYVERPWTTSSPDNPLEYLPSTVAYSALYDRQRDPPRKLDSRQILWVLTPNTYNGPQTRFLPGVDEVVATLRSEGRLAFVVRRKGWE